MNEAFLTGRDEEMQHFWRRSTREYLPTIATRSKWAKNPEPINVGDIVYLCDDDYRRGWRMGRIVEARAGDEGVIRRAVVQTADGSIYHRGVH